ncbi:MAG: rod shape-determining protein [Clostridia bacterium]|nr:rod shape-determining protein [Clostridia bacterium]
MYENIGIDLGASRIVVSAAGEGVLSAVPSVAAIRRQDGSFLGIGEDADRCASEGEGVVLRHLFRESMVAPEFTCAAIAHSLVRHGADPKDGGVFFSIPCGFGEVEESALAEMATQAGVEDAYFVYSPLAALVGNGLDPATDAVIVDIGAMRTNMMAVCHGRIFGKKTYPVGGESFDRAIIDYLLRKRGIRVTAETAETVKIRIGTVWVGNEKRVIDVPGRDATNGDYCTVRISSEEMFTALEEPMASLIEGVCETITKIPPDCVQDVFDTGILLAGGGCLLEGIDKMIGGVTGVNASRLSDPRETVALGLAALADDNKSLKLTGTRNISRYIMKTSALPRRGIEV